MIKRYLFTFTLIIAIPVFLLLAGFFRLFETALIRNLSAQSLDTTQQIAQRLDEEAKRIALMASALAHNEMLLSYVQTYCRATNSSESYQATHRVSEQLDSLLSYTNQVGAIFFFFKKKNMLYHRNIQIAVTDQAKQSDWYQRVLQHPGKTFILQTFAPHTEQRSAGVFLSCAIAMDTHPEEPGLEMILVSFKSQIASNIFLQHDHDETGSLWILNAADDIILEQPGSPERELLLNLSVSAEEQTLKNHRGKFLVISHPVPYANMKLVKIFNHTIFTRNIRQYAWYARMALAGIVGLFFIFTAAFFRSIIRPLKNVSQKMEQVGQGDMSVQVAAEGMAELNALSHTFNLMVSRIRELTHQIEQKEHQRAQAEIDALQFQINPHFLSNTLNAIKMMATMVHAENIQKMTGALMTILSASFRNAGALSQLKDQLANLESYTYIMKVRFGNSFDVVTTINEDIKGLYVLKMLLQPVLENSILHGIREVERKGRIDIAGWRKQDRLYLQITDNGIGIPPDTLSSTWNRTGHPHQGLNGIGIRNVHERIRLNYGEEYGLSIHSVLGKGTRVTFTLPVIEGKQHV
jgi:two-component system sensor histidine kinase YesM